MTPTSRGSDRKTSPATSVESHDSAAAKKHESDLIIETIEGNDCITFRNINPSEHQKLIATSKNRLPQYRARNVSALIQAAPSILAAEAHRGKKIMEVVINRSLIPATSGDGYRAFAHEKGRIVENARLKSAGKIRTAASLAAVWQVASVVVAQVHLVEINKNLDQIKHSVEQIGEALKRHRRSEIAGTIEYIQQAYQMLSNGHLPTSVTHHLETCEHALLKLQIDITEEIDHESKTEPRDSDTLGTETIYKNGIAKYKKISALITELEVCIQARILNWFVCSAIHGESILSKTRMESMRRSLDTLGSIRDTIEHRRKDDVSRIDSFWNTSETLSARKALVQAEAIGVQIQLTKARASLDDQICRISTQLSGKDRFIIETIDGKVHQVSHSHLAS